MSGKPKSAASISSETSSVIEDSRSAGAELSIAAGRRRGSLWLSLLFLFLNGSWAVYHFQYENLPLPITADVAGKRGFSEVSAMEHVKYLTSLGPHPVGSEALDLAVKYVMAESEKIKKTAHWEVDVQVNLFRAKLGANCLSGGLFKGKTLVYSDLEHVVLRILPRYLSDAEENAILVSSHIDTVFSAEGAGDCSSCISVILELARGISQWAHGFKNNIIFLFNTGEEEGLNGAHSFISQHPWSSTVRFVVDLEAMGIGGPSGIFQSGPTPWVLETFAKVARYPSGQIIAQDLFRSGAIKSATDFQVYQEMAGLPGLDLAYVDSSAVYHTKNDKLKLLKPGSLQHLGENMLAFLRQAAISSDLQKELATSEQGKDQDPAIFFDFLGMYMVVYRQSLATMLHNSVVFQAILIWATSLVMGGYSGAISFVLAWLSTILMWIFSLGFSTLVAFLLPLISSSPIPYIASPWLVVGLFGVPALLGGLLGQHIGFLFLQKHLRHSFSERIPVLSPYLRTNIVKWEAERWLFKAGFLQWLILLIAGNYFKVGSTYMALVWFVSPAFAYGFLEATLTPTRLPRQLKAATLILALLAPILFSAGGFIRLLGTITGNMVRFERNPGSTPEWLGNLIVAIYIAAVICLSMVQLLSYFHLSDAKGLVIFALCATFGLSMAAVLFGIFPTFTEDTSRAINVVHVVDTSSTYNDIGKPLSYISLFSSTPGKLDEEVKALNDEGFTCGRNKTVDFVTFTVKYGCWSYKDPEGGWTKSDIPTIRVESDSNTDFRKTRVLIDTKQSIRWALAINWDKIRDFTFDVDSDEVGADGEKSVVDGWHIIQFSGGRNSPTRFHVNLFWADDDRNPQHSRTEELSEDRLSLLLKLRTDVNKVTPRTTAILEKLPRWCSQFGKSSSPYNLAFLTSLPVHF